MFLNSFILKILKDKNMIEEKITNKEIEQLEKVIEKLNKKFIGLYIGVAIGFIIIFYSIIYFMQHPDIIAGSVSLFGIGLVIALMNFISAKQIKKRIKELNEDLEKLKEKQS